MVPPGPILKSPVEPLTEEVNMYGKRIGFGVAFNLTQGQIKFQLFDIPHKAINLRRILPYADGHGAKPDEDAQGH